MKPTFSSILRAVLAGCIGGWCALWLHTTWLERSHLPELAGHVQVGDCLILFKRADRSVWIVEVVSDTMFALRNTKGSVIYQMPEQFEKYFIRTVCPVKEIR